MGRPLPPVDDPAFPHGTYRGAQVERRRHGTTGVCPECREAFNAYHRDLTRRRTQGVVDAARTNRARNRAALRVAKRHPAEFEAAIALELLNEYLASRGRTA